ncbi:MAG: hypothetical protein WDZ51_08295 [Pirellulaceae bacterium]
MTWSRLRFHTMWQQAIRRSGPSSNRRSHSLIVLLVGIACVMVSATCQAEANLQVAVGEIDITPKIDAAVPVWIAGYGHGRAAMSVHDPIMARALLLSDGSKRMALVSVDLIGLQFQETERIRERLPDLDYIMVASTHNHEGPDTIGIWGENPLRRGVDEAYLDLVVNRVAKLLTSLEANLEPVTMELGTTRRPDLLHDSRLPIVLDPVIRALLFRSTKGGEPVALLLQQNCHPEALGSKNTALTADFPHYTIGYLREKLDCPVVLVSGAIGGLMAPPPSGIQDEAGRELPFGTFEYAKRYGNELGAATMIALENAKSLPGIPLDVETRQVAIPIDNYMYRLARSLKVIVRESYEWTGSPEKFGKAVSVDFRPDRPATRTEVALIRMGDLAIACLPGELNPELVYGEIVDPPEANVDFPDAPPEPHLTAMFADRPWMFIGLANDEVGYIIPKRQWDFDPPYAYGRAKPQYGEINSCGPDTAPILLNSLRDCFQELEKRW